MLDPRKLPRAANGRILWSRVPGFREWLLKTAPSLTQRELTDAIHERHGMLLSRAAVQGLRQQFNVQMSAETKRRAYQQRSEHNPVKPNPAEPTLSPEEKLEQDLARREIARLTGRQTFFEMLGQKIMGAVASLPTLPVVRPPSIQVSKGLGEEEMVLLISDVQAGLKVDAHESGGLGSFGSGILLDQITYLLKSIASIRKYHPNVRRLHVFWLGDIVEGETIYGGQLREIDANVIQQVLLCWEHFSAFQAQLAGLFEAVHCRGVVGNHGRIGRKGEHSPMSNFDYLLYRMWEERLRPAKNLTWKVSESWWDIAEVMGWKWLLVHGDDAGVGWAGIPFYAVVRHKARYRELFKQLREEFGDFDFMAAGHHSVIAHFNAIWLNGSWPGGTEFSLKRLQLGDVPAQWLMGVHKERGVTWARPIHLRPLKVEKTA